jgi:hypothetical protein
MPGRERRWALGRVLLGAGAVAFVAAASDDPPPLEPPANLPPLTVPTPPADASPRPEDRPILAVPGLPGLGRPAPAAAPTPAPAPTVIDELPEDGPPPLVAPSGAPGPAPGRLTPLRPAPAARRAEAGTISLEPVPADGLDPLKPTTRPGTRPDDDPAEPGSRPVPPPPRRGLFGLFSRPAPPPPPADEPIRVEPRDDPAADAALKRRIEAQVRRAVGDRTRSIDVRVRDRRVYVRAQVQRFWQKRAVRRTLETLPALSGYKTVVDVVE